MCLYYVMRPDNVTAPAAVFTRYGHLCKNEASAKRRAERCCGRVYSTDGHRSRLVADFYQEPAPVPEERGRAYWQKRAQAALFA